MSKPTSPLVIMPSTPNVRELVDGPATMQADIEAALRELERAETAAIDEIDAISARRHRLLVDAPDDIIDTLDRELAPATRRLERIEARQCALYEKLAEPLLRRGEGDAE